MYFDLSQISGRNGYKLLTASVVPRPIAWVVSQDANGSVNTAPFSFFNLMSGEPPVACVGVGSRAGRRKDTADNILATRDFVINLVSMKMLEQMNVTAIEFPPGVNEAEAAGLTLTPCPQTGVPRIEGSAVAMECRLRQALELGNERYIMVADVLGVEIIDEAIMDREKCYVDTAKLDLVARMQSPGGYCRPDNIVRLPPITLEAWQDR